MGQFTFSGGGGGGGGGAVTSVFGRVGVVIAVNGDYTASNITNVPAGNIAAVTVQAAVDELDTEKAGLALANIFTAANTFNLNVTAAPAPPAGTVVHVVAADGSASRLALDAFGSSAQVNQRRANGTNAAKSAVLSGDSIGSFNAFGYGATGYIATSSAAVQFAATENWTDTADGTEILFRTVTNGTTALTTRWGVRNDGSLTYNGGTLTGVSTVNAVDYFDNGVNINTIYAGLAAANVFSAVQTIDLNTAALPAPITGTALHIGNADGVLTRLQLDSFAQQTSFTGRRANGTAALPTALISNEQIIGVNAFGYGATAYSATSRGSMGIFASENWTDAATGTRIIFSTTPNLSTTSTTRWGVENDGSFVYSGGALTGVSTVNATDYFDNGVNINLIYASLALPNVFTALQTISINATAPGAPFGASMLHLLGVDADNARATLDAFGGSAQITVRRASGTNAAKSAVLLGESIGSINSAGYGATGYGSNSTGALNFLATENWTDSAQGTRLSVRVASNGTATPNSRWGFEQDGSFVYVAGALTGASTINALGYWHTGVEVIDANRIFRPRSYTVGTLPGVTATGIIHCSDLGGGAGLLSSDGTGWVREDNTGTTTIATDAGHTFTWDRLVDAPTTRGNATLTALRTATLSTTGCRNGDRASFVRLGGGAFNWAIAGGTTFNLTGADQFCTFEFDGTTWNIIDGGRITVAAGSGVDVQDEGIAVITATALNFVGAGVTATNGGGGVATVTIPGSSGVSVGKVVGIANASYF